MINKFLHPNGGSETYVFKLGEYLKTQGHEVQYFGMEHEGRCVGNRVDAYTSDMDFHNGNKLAKLTYPIKTIYSSEARRKIRLVLDDFQPDVCHINNFNFQLTPSILLEMRKHEKENNRKVKIVFTAHDSQLVCPNHLMQNPLTHKTCTKCLGGKYLNCTNGKCIHGSLAKSLVGTFEAFFWNFRHIYKNIDVVISPSDFLAKKLAFNKDISSKIRVLHNFIDTQNNDAVKEKEDYILYFGRYSNEKGIPTLIEVAKQLNNIKFVFAGGGPLVDEVNQIGNIENKGFLSGCELKDTISKALFTVIPSECFENCPFTVMESQILGTPVLGADIGGIPELIQVCKTGELFESGNSKELKNKILTLWNDRSRLNEYSENCKNISFDTIDEYYKKLFLIYTGQM